MMLFNCIVLVTIPCTAGSWLSIASVREHASEEFAGPNPAKRSGAFLGLTDAKNGSDLHSSLDMQASSYYRSPASWGPPTWFFLHSLTLAQEENISVPVQQSIKELLTTLQTTLPCPSCGKHLARHMEESPIDPHLGTRAELVQWMIDLHNTVNRDRGVRVLSNEEVMREYNLAFNKEESQRYMAVLSHSAAAEHVLTFVFVLVSTLVAW
mmetsp:Transcript_52641/g.140320  ORF Transcript_52641/g.140320 Transcript_52641/m.140320 type:complete len:210 (-) Transcript_52641:81-710(-)